MLAALYVGLLINVVVGVDVLSFSVPVEPLLLFMRRNPARARHSDD